MFTCMSWESRYKDVVINLCHNHTALLESSAYILQSSDGSEPLPERMWAQIIPFHPLQQDVQEVGPLLRKVVA